MSIKDSFEYVRPPMKVALVAAIVWIVILVIVGFTGCATTCIKPEVRAAKHGIVLECSDDDVQTECLVSTKDGDHTYSYLDCR